MLNGMTEETLERIVGDGIIGITCQPIPNTSDVKRLRAAVKQNRQIPEGAPVPVWDFVVCRGDGSRVRFHPNLTSKKIDVADWTFVSWTYTGP